MTHSAYLLALTALAFGIFSCEKPAQERQRHDVGVLTPAVAVAPENEMEINLDTLSVLVEFSWSKASWEGTGWPAYDVAFDLLEGDFSKPLMVCHASTLDTLSLSLGKPELKELFNTIAAGEKISTVQAKWAVRTSSASRKVSDEPRTLTLHMTPDPDAFKAGNEVYIDGEGSAEGRRKMTYIPSTTFSWDKSISKHYNDGSPYCKNFDYEIFTRLEAGKVFYLWSGESTGDKDWIFSFESSDATSYTMDILREAHYGATVESDGVYRIRINTSSKEIYVKGPITKVNLRYWKPIKDNELHYDGLGVWSGDITIPSKNQQGYKFLFIGLDGDQPTGAQYIDEATPTGDPSSWNPADRYWHIVTVQGGGADGKRGNGTFLVPSEALNTPMHYTIYMNDTFGTYTHSIGAVE